MEKESGDLVVPSNVKEQVIGASVLRELQLCRRDAAPSLNALAVSEAATVAQEALQLSSEAQARNDKLRLELEDSAARFSAEAARQAAGSPPPKTRLCFNI